MNSEDTKTVREKKQKSDEDEREVRILVDRVKEGDAVAFEDLVFRFQHKVYGIAYAMLGDGDEAKDIAQDAFVQIFRAIGTFRGDSKFSTWMTSVVINLCRRRRRWWARRRHYIAGSVEDMSRTDDGQPVREFADNGPGADEQVIKAELRRQVIEGLRKLDEPGRTMVVLRDIRDLSYEEIAQIMKCRVGTVKSRLSRARLKLKEILQRELER